MERAFGCHTRGPGRLTRRGMQRAGAMIDLPGRLIGGGYSGELPLDAPTSPRLGGPPGLKQKPKTSTRVPNKLNGDCCCACSRSDKSHHTLSAPTSTMFYCNYLLFSLLLFFFRHFFSSYLPPTSLLFFLSSSHLCPVAWNSCIASLGVGKRI